MNNVYEMNKNQSLTKLIDEAETLLINSADYTTVGAKIALQYMVNQAKLALSTPEDLPFTRNRSFHKPRVNEREQFASKRFTMVRTHEDDSSKVFDYYGLEDAIKWFKKQDLNSLALEKLNEKRKLVSQKAKEILSNAIYGSNVGQFDENKKQKLVESLHYVESNLSSKSEIAKAIVQCHNKIRDFKHSQVLRTDIETSSNLFLSEKGLQEVKDNIEKDEGLQNELKKIQSLAHTYSLDYLKSAHHLMNESKSVDELNSLFYLWSSTDKIANFTAPPNAVSATISFVLPKLENEKDGLGHVWVDNIDIISANGLNLPIKNNGFDIGVHKPNHWNPIVQFGNPQFKWEGQYPFSGGGDKKNKVETNLSSQIQFTYDENTKPHSLYICNPTSEDEGAWMYDEIVPIEAGTSYTLTFNAKIDGKFKKGLKTVIYFKDVNGETINSFEYYFNRKSSLPNNCFLLTLQCDAILYAFTQEIEYAEKAKLAMIYTLNELCQGAEHWLVHNSRPDGSDAYGAVQAGRAFSSIASAYSLIKHADVFTQDEKNHFYGLVEYMLPYLLDLRPRTELSSEAAQRNTGNWQTDMCAGTAMMMMVLEDFPNRKDWLYNATSVLHAQLVLNVNNDYSWPESIRYHYAALERFAVFAKAFQFNCGENWFETTDLAHMFIFPIEMQTPCYQYFDDHISTPPFGDHALGDGSEFGSFPIYIEDIARVNRPLADKMYHTWVKAGKPYKKLWGESIAFENLLSAGNQYIATDHLLLSSTKSYPDAGIYIFRNKKANNKESYCAIMSSYKPIDHGHLDQGSFIIYKDSIPIVMDSGIEGYFDSSTQWHISSYSHACLQFQTKMEKGLQNKSNEINLTAGTYSIDHGWSDVPKTSSIIDCEVGSAVESITIKIVNPEGTGIHYRSIHYIREMDIYIIDDKIEDFSGDILFSLPVAAKSSTIHSQSVYCHGAHEIDLETVFLHDVKFITTEKGRSTKFFESGHDNFSMMEYIRATANAKDGFLTVLYPKYSNDPAMVITKFDQDKFKIEIEKKQIHIRKKNGRVDIY